MDGYSKTPITGLRLTSCNYASVHISGMKTMAKHVCFSTSPQSWDSGSHGRSLSTQVMHLHHRVLMTSRVAAFRSADETPFGHCPSTADKTDARKILTAAPLENWTRPPRRPRTTWMKTIQQDLKFKTSPWKKQSSWLRSVHSGDWCLRLVLCILLVVLATQEA